MNSLSPTVPRIHRIVAVGLILTTWLWGIRSDSVQAQQSDSQQQVVVLGNGRTLHGLVTRSGERYFVQVSHGEVSVRVAEVDAVCSDLQQAFEHRRAQLGWGTPESHAQLAQWCLNQEMLDQAVAEVRAGRAIDPEHPLLHLIALRVETETARRGTRTSTTSPTPQGQAPDPEAPSADDLARLVGDMPPEGVARFTRTVQPILLNRCATANCHGTTHGGSFQLRRPAWGTIPTRSNTQRNLHAVMRQVVRSNPMASPLLIIPSQPHGTAPDPIFNERQAGQAHELAQWVRFLAVGSPRPVATTEPILGSPTVQSATQEPLVEPPETFPTVQASYLDPSASPFSQSMPREMPEALLADIQQFGAPESPIQHGASLPVFIPADPFDPEIFNRLYSRR